MISNIWATFRIFCQSFLVLGFVFSLSACVNTEDLDLNEPGTEEGRCQLPPSQGKLAEVDLWARTFLDPESVNDLGIDAEGGLAVNFIIKPLTQTSGEFFFDKNLGFLVNGVEYDLRNRQRYNRTFPVQTSTLTVREYNENYERTIPETMAANAVVVRVLIPGAKIDRSAVMKLRVKLGWGQQSEEHQFQILPKCVL